VLQHPLSDENNRIVGGINSVVCAMILCFALIRNLSSTASNQLRAPRFICSSCPCIYLSCRKRRATGSVALAMADACTRHTLEHLSYVLPQCSAAILNGPVGSHQYSQFVMGTTPSQLQIVRTELGELLRHLDNYAC